MHSQEWLCHRFFNSLSEAYARGKLERARPAGTEHLRHAAGGLAESGTEQIAAVARQVRDVEQIKNFADQRHPPAVAEGEFAAQAEIVGQ